MKKILLSTAVIGLTVSLTLTVAHSQDNFTISYNSTLGATYDLIKTYDNKFVVLANNCYMALFKIDSSGNIEWANHHIRINNSFINSVIQQADSGLVTLASTNDTSEIVKFDKDGNFIWSKLYSKSFSTLLPTNDGGFLIGGSNIIAKCDNSGNLNWQKTIPILISKIASTSSTDFLVSGIAFGNATDVCFAKLDNSGTVLWAKRFAGNDYDWSAGIVETTDKGCIIGGYSKSFGTTYNQPFLLRTDSAGNLTWSHIYLTNDETNFNSIKILSDEKLIITGNTFYNDIRNVEVLYMKADKVGNIEWARSAGGNGYNDAFALCIENDNSIFMGGAINGLGVIKLDSSGNGFCSFDSVNITTSSPAITLTTENFTSSNAVINTLPFMPSFLNTPIYRTVLCTNTAIINLSENNNGVTIFPNPCSSATTLQTDNLLHNATLTVYNCFGQTVKQIENVSGQTLTLQRDNLPSGLYFLRLTQDSKVNAVDKLVIADN